MSKSSSHNGSPPSTSDPTNEDQSDFFLPLVVLMIFAFFRVIFPTQYRSLMAEGSVIETSQVILYLIAAFRCILASFSYLRSGRIFRAVLLFIGFPVLLFICGEEVDWGQRFFGFTNPDWMTLTNGEHGFALHNWDVLSPLFQWAYVLLGSVLALSSSVVSSWKNKKGWRGLYELLPSPSLMFFFLPAALFFLYLRIVHPTYGGPFLFEDQELFELLFAAGIFYHMQRIRSVARVKK